ncbi:hypothetical protein GGP41_006984 [Bipolaris sorokiniana]|uniref:Uncharacterized protein n=1 Tax=Cochliobolus sativus TaxID=45130 RepID=A0A8H5ZRB1_COCSA|nr:hypothetical protein GGP41_006984 [Bipolaris sorokiniana]
MFPSRLDNRQNLIFIEDSGVWIPRIGIIRLIKLPRVIVTAYCLSAENVQQIILDTLVAYSLDDGASISTILSLRN